MSGVRRVRVRVCVCVCVYRRGERGETRERKGDAGNAGSAARTITLPLDVMPTDAIAKLLEPPPAGSTAVKMKASRFGIVIGRSSSATTCGSGKARVVVSALRTNGASGL